MWCLWLSDTRQSPIKCFKRLLDWAWTGWCATGTGYREGRHWTGKGDPVYFKAIEGGWWVRFGHSKEEKKCAPWRRMFIMLLKIMILWEMYVIIPYKNTFFSVCSIPLCSSPHRSQICGHYSCVCHYPLVSFSPPPDVVSSSSCVPLTALVSEKCRGREIRDAN